jgi:hypothetical protein
LICNISTPHLCGVLRRVTLPSLFFGSGFTVSGLFLSLVTRQPPPTLKISEHRTVQLGAAAEDHMHIQSGASP